MLVDIRDTPAGIGPGVPAIVAGIVRFVRAARARWRVMFLLAGAVLTVVGVVLASGAVLIPGVLVLLFALFYGIGSSGCISADQLAGWPWRG
jgi:cell division protein FtsX